MMEEVLRYLKVWFLNPDPTPKKSKKERERYSNEGESAPSN